MKLVCRECKYEQTVSNKSLTQCPNCSSNNIKYFLFGSAGGKAVKSGIFGTSIFCECLCELIFPLIVFLIIYLAIIGSA